MSQVERKIRVLCLLSGSLDSQLAASVLQEQGIEVRAVTFTSPFFDHGPARRAAQALGLDAVTLDFSAGMVRVLNASGRDGADPPCTLCRVAMLQRAGEVLAEDGYDFIATGEVLNQRTPSQASDVLESIARDCGYYGYVLRPLSATLLPETEVERRGWVARERLLGLEGRSRKAQLRLAAEYNIREYPHPSSVCRLTDESFIHRARDLRDHEGLCGVRDLQLLSLGRHFRLGRSTKLVVGRNQDENVEIEGTAELYDLILRIEGAPGPIGVLPFTASPDETMLAASICARYADTNGSRKMTVRIRTTRESRRIDVEPAGEEVVEKYRI